jgi:hypothetical protein
MMPDNAFSGALAANPAPSSAPTFPASPAPPVMAVTLSQSSKLSAREEEEEEEEERSMNTCAIDQSAKREYKVDPLGSV